MSKEIIEDSLSLKCKLLIVGSKPLPIGGVTMHVDRLCKWLDLKGVKYDYLDIRRDGIVSIILKIISCDVCHLHFSNPIVVLFLVIWAKMTGSSCIFTLHGNIFFRKAVKRYITKLAIKISDVPIMLNRGSFDESHKLNKRSRLISAFIPPLGNENLDLDFSDQIKKRATDVAFTIITNAYSYATDKDGQEIYGVFALIEFFKQKNVLIIISDPSGTYFDAALKKYKGRKYVLNNVLFLSRPHSFFAALEYADVFIRNTITDGDSISIHEALLKGKEVWATNVVDRPRGVNVYNLLSDISTGQGTKEKYTSSSSIDELIELYNSMMLSK